MWLNIVILSGLLGLTVAVRAVIHLTWPNEKRRQHNDLIGWQLSVLGTVYAVMLGFMLYAVWNNYQIAEGNAEAEANATVNTARCALGLPEPYRSKIRSLCAAYLNAMLKEEWPAMMQQRSGSTSARIVEDIWKTTTGVQVKTAAEQTNLSQTLTHLADMTERRRLRLMQAVAGLPTILWVVLSVGGVVIVASACMFGSVNSKVQFVQVLMLSILLSLILMAISELSQPFQGAIRVPPTAFAKAREALYNAETSSN